MDRDESYFIRTNWFIWIGFTTSIVMILLVGLTLSPEWSKKTEPSLFADYFINILIALGLISSFWLQMRLRKILLQQAIIKHSLPLASHHLAHQGHLTLLYSLFLLSNELFVGIGFYYGFILNDSTRFYYYGLASLACNFLTLPNITLRIPRVVFKPPGAPKP